MSLSLDDKEGLKNFLLENTYVNSTTGCWEYLGVIVNGYGQLKIEDKGYKVNRLSLFIFKRFNLHSKLMALHISACPFKNCWNPDHIYSGNNSNNQQDAVTTNTHYQSQKTHCPEGHPYTSKNTAISKNGTRICKQCRAIRNKKEYHRLQKIKRILETI